MDSNQGSFLERKAAWLLDEGDIIYKREFSFPDLKSAAGILLRFDFAIFETAEDAEAGLPKFLLEMQGEQHFRPKFTNAATFARQQANDKRKRQYCSVKGIPLVAIPYTDFNTMTLDSILEAGKFFD